MAIIDWRMGVLVNDPSRGGSEGGVCVRTCDVYSKRLHLTTPRVALDRARDHAAYSNRPHERARRVGRSHWSVGLGVASGLSVIIGWPIRGRGRG